MRILHTSDWHLGRQFHNVSLIEDQQAVLEQLIQYLKENPVDVVIVAGDIYDRSVPPTAAIELLNNVVKRICNELNIPMILISGNHDGAERLGFGAEQMKSAGLHIISNFDDMLTPVVINTKVAGDVAFYGMPYSDPEQVRFAFPSESTTAIFNEPMPNKTIANKIIPNKTIATHDQAHKLLAEKITEQFKPDHRNVLISHCFVDGAIESESERPLSIGGSDRVSHEHFLNFDYVALGHLHQPQKKGEEYIRYSGSLMKYSFGEQHQKKGFTLVDINQNGFVATEHIELTAPHEMRIVEGELEQVIAQGKVDPKNEDYLLVRLMDKHAILNPMDKLRTVYPNVLHLEKPGMLIGVEQEMAKAKLARSEMDMFRDFFVEAQDSELSQVQDQAISDIIKQLSQTSSSANSLSTKSE